jgi:inosine/xanthosine triphosphate pyrophosphatase family protein
MLKSNIDALLCDNKKLLESAYERLLLGVTFPRICRIVYLLYPEFFLNGVVVKGVRMNLTRDGQIYSEGPHHPQTYNQKVLVSFLKAVASVYDCNVNPGFIGLLLEELEADFSESYLREFPHVIRIVSGNQFKRKEFSNGFGMPSVEFVSYEFVEIQGSTEEIVIHKLDQLTPPLISEIVVVDDTSLELSALDGFPGPYVKPMLAVSPIDKIGDKLSKLGDSSGLVVHTIGVRFFSHTTVLVVKFPIVWGLPSGVGQSFDPYCYYDGKPLTALNGWFRHVIAFWIKIMVQRVGRPPPWESTLLICQ